MAIANTTGLAVSVGTAKKAVTIHDQKNMMIPQFKMLLNNDEEKAERAFRIAATEYNKSSGLQNCDRASFWGCVINAVQMDLEPGPLGHVYLIPYKGVATLQLGYKGILELVSRSNRVDSVYAYPVYKDDLFKFKLGSHPDITHTPDFESEPIDSNLIGFYAVAHIKDCAIPRIEFMTKKQVDAIKNRAQARSGPWITDYAEMGRKTVLKRICKSLPLSVKVQAALAKDDTVRKSLAKVNDIEIDDSTSVFDMIQTSAESSNMEEVETVDVSTGEVING